MYLLRYYKVLLRCIKLKINRLRLSNIQNKDITDTFRDICIVI